MADPLSLLKKKKEDAPKASATPSLSPAKASPASLFDIGSSLGGGSSRNAGASSLFDVSSSLGATRSESPPRAPQGASSRTFAAPAADQPDDPFEPTFLEKAPRAQTFAAPSRSEEEQSSGGYPGDPKEPIDWGVNRARKRDDAMDKFWTFGSKLKENLDSVGGIAKRNIAAATESAKAMAGVQESLPRPDLPKLPVRPDTERPVLNIQFDGMLPGEKVHHTVKQAFLISTNPFCEISGRLLVTNYRLKFQVPKGTLREELAWMQEKQVMDVPLGLIEEVKLESPPSDTGAQIWRLRINTKDNRSLAMLVSDPQDMLVVEEHVAALAMPGENFTSVLFAFRHAQESGRDHTTSAGWGIFNPEAEFSRMGVDTSASPSSSPYSLTTANKEYTLCSSYPAWLVRPKSISDTAFRNAANFRKRGRLPTMSWCGGPALGFASLWRCSQPTEGLLGKASQEDEGLIQAIRQGVGAGRDRELLTLDLRSQKAAYANKVGGGGFEQYSHCRLVFGNIDNVHGVREAWRKMCKAVSGLSGSEVGTWFKDVANSCWYDVIGTIMNCVSMVVAELEDLQCNVLIHCSDGWDRTAQVSSLTMLCTDPHYRTLKGFLILIQKEFCSFGHRFRTRLGNGEQQTSESSPIFIQWLECVFQLMAQFPEAFEFTSALLLFIAKEVYTNRYGTFITDSEKERKDVMPRTLSIWAVILDAGSAGPAAEHLNPKYKKAEGILRPSPSQIRYEIWEDYWFRYHLHPRDERC